MNRLFSLFLVALIGFNMLGYSVFRIYSDLSPSNSAGLVSNDDLVLKVPFYLPYVSEWAEGQSSVADIEIDNSYFKVVTRSIHNDTLFLHCEYQQNSKERFWDLVNSLDLDKASQPVKPTELLKNLIKLYCHTYSKLLLSPFEWCSMVSFPPLVMWYQECSGLSFDPPPWLPAMHLFNSKLAS